MVVSTWTELVQSLAIRWAVLGDRLVIRRGGTAAAMANQDNRSDARLASKESHSGPHIKSNELPIHRRFVVFESRVHAENAEAPPGQFLGRGMSEIVAGAMDS